MKIAVFSDLKDNTPSSHYNRLAARDITKALRIKGYNVNHFKVSNDNWQEALKVPGKMIFNMIDDSVHGLYQKVAGGLEKLGRPQLGNDSKTFKTVCDKVTVKKILSKHDIPTPKFKIVDSEFDGIGKLKYPLIVKPTQSHSSLGIDQKSVVTDNKELVNRINYLRNNKSIKDIYLEEFVNGREIYVTILGNKKHAYVLPYCEMYFAKKTKKDNEQKWDIYTYTAKWDRKSFEWYNNWILCPIDVSYTLEKKIEHATLKAFKALKLRDLARMDLRIDSKEDVYIIDVNSTPCLNEAEKEQEMVTISARAMQWSYADFIDILVKTCCERAYGK